MNPQSPIVDLGEFEGLGLIIRWPSGVRYTNQTSGFACHHPETEGVFVPLSDGVGKPVLHSISQHFHGGWHPLEDSDAEILNRILAKHGLAFIEVDKTALATSYEAWVTVNISEDTDSRFGPRVTGFGKTTGILTWPNSD